ncbi:uncharacterized protein LOC111343857 [Stylophora pistillata]|uniref:uncharacterized protein LOC111343857 n=1 Tax=Stylophora pistillata TaxID=50429 RepID=UPI000C04E6BB|nr:uncharacterized protein LOC111343857 [Stylophora pistillata]
MASASEVFRSDTTLAVCRLVEETKGHEMLKYLGPGCLVHFSDTCTPKILSSNSSGKTSISERASSYFLVASAEVLKKIQLEAFENKPNRSVKIVAEFVRARDGRTLERKTLSPIREGELCRALDDIVESDGMIFIALSKLKRSIFSKSNLFSRALEVVEVQGENSSARMANDLQCILFTLVTSGKKAFRLQDNPVFGTKVYDLLQFDTVLTREDPSRFPRYFLRNEERKRFLAEDEFPKDEIAFGAIILQGVMFAGVLNFDNSDNRQPSPVFVGNRLETAIQRHNERESERLVGAVGGIYPLLDPKSEERPKANDKIGNYDFPQPAASPSGLDQFVAGFQSKNDGNNGAENLRTLPCAIDLAESGEKKENSGENSTDEKASPIENSCRSEDLGNSVDCQRIFYAMNLENKPFGEFSAPEQSPETGIGGSEEEVQAEPTGPAGQQGRVEDAEQEERVAQGIQGNQEVSTVQQLREISAAEEPQRAIALQRNQNESVPQGFQVPPTTMVPQGPLVTFGIQRNPLEAPLAPGGPPKGSQYPLLPSPERCLEAQGASSDLKSLENGALFQNGQNRDEGRPPSLQSPRKEEHPEVKHSISVTNGCKKTYKLDDPLTRTLLGWLELLEALCRSLDKEYKYGQCKYWKHLAEHFHISEQEYQRFEYQPVLSPTELMFEYLQTSDPDVTIGCLKDGLRQIQRLDVINVLILHEKCDPAALNDETLVSSLFDSDPDIIGEIAYLLDIQKSGVKKWSDLAPKLNIPRNIFRKFENCYAGNPTEKMFEVVKVHYPNLTVGELIDHLKALKRRDVIKAIEKSTRVTKKSVIKELVADVDIMEEVCDLLNQKTRTTTVSGLKQLGKRLKIKTETLDDLLPTQEENKSPTEALIRHLGGFNPNLTLSNLIWALHEISRPDVIVLLDEYLPAECVSRLLVSSCNCQICQQVLPRETGES